MMMPGDAPEPIELSEEVRARIRELQAVLTESQRKADKAEDEDIREALNLQISNIGLRVSRLRRGLPEEIPAKEVVAEDEIPALPQPSESERAEADMLVQRAMLEKRRGNKQAAMDLLRKAADVAPGSATVLEALADDLAENRRFGEAQKVYRDARRQDPKNASIERKLAQLATQSLSHLSIEDQLRMSSDPLLMKHGESMANPKFAVALSVMVPGLGQIVLGLVKKGVVIFGIFAVSVVLAIVVARFVPHADRSVSPITYFFIAVAFVTYFAQLMDISSTAKSAERRSASKPRPPVNLPFD